MLCIQTVERTWPGDMPPSAEHTGESSRVSSSVAAPLIAIIDDNTDIVAAVTEMLDELGYRVVSYRDAADALEVMQQSEVPSLIVLDLMMPRMDGWTFRVRQRASDKLRDIPVIVLSASGGAQAEAIDADAFLRKPLRMEQLCATIEQMLARAERRRLLSHSAELERLRALGFLAASIAHEINNPLTYISGNLDLALRDSQDLLHSSDLAKAVGGLQTRLGNARVGTDHVAEIVSGLLVFARAEHDADKTANLTRSIEGALQLARAYARPRARLVFHKVELPFVIGQEGRLAQVFLNLIMNAAQAIAPGASEANSISISARSDGQLVTVEIADTGGGIPKEDMERVFDAFFTTKPAGQGTGIGLSFCRDILAQVGGSIRVVSSNEHGTTIGVSLRVAAST